MSDDEQTQSAEQAQIAELQARIDALEAGGDGEPDKASAPAASLAFELVPTGRTHTVNGVEQPITDAAGNPEAVWTLQAHVEGVTVPLLTKPASFVENEQIRQQRLAAREQSPS